MLEEIEKQSRDIAEAFNKKPKEGIKRIMRISAEKSVDPTEQISEFFRNQKNNLNLESVGDYLSGEKEQNKEVLKHFSKGMDFAGKEFVPAMREYLQEFKLPGEAQKIDRIVERFADEYTAQNPSGKISSPVAAYVLSFQTIMLNTDLHNANIKESDKMTVEGMKRNLRGTNDGEDFPPEVIKGIYEEIKNEPFKLNFAEVTPGYNYSSPDLGKDDAYKAFSADILNSEDVQKVVPGLKDKNIETEVKRPNKWLGKLIGMTTSVKITDKETGAQVELQTYKPSVFPKLFSKKEPTTIIQPVVVEGQKASKDSLKLASNVAAGFSTQPTSIEATYDYEKSDLTKSYTEAKVQTQQLKTSIAKEAAQTVGQAIKKKDFISKIKSAVTRHNPNKAKKTDQSMRL